MITQNFNIYLHAGIGVAPVVHASQYSQGETWTFTILDNDGSVYRPSSGALIGLKSDGRVIAGITGTVNADGSVSIVTTQQLTAAAGRGVFELTIDGGTNGTANFIVEVEKKPTEDGILSESDLSIIQQGLNSVTPAVITETVSDYLEEHMTNPPIDPTLTISNAAADAKVTGDNITDLKNAIDEIGEALYTETDTVPTVVNGYWSNGVFTASSGTLSRKATLNGTKKVRIEGTINQYYDTYVFLDESDNVISFLKNMNPTGWQNVVADVPDGAVYVASSTSTSAYAETIKIYFLTPVKAEVENLKENYESITRSVSNLENLEIEGYTKTDYADCIVNATLNTSKIIEMYNGYATPANNREYKYYVLPVAENETYRTTGINVFDTRPMIYTDDNDRVLAYYPSERVTTPQIVTVENTVPSGATRLYVGGRADTPITIERKTINFTKKSSQSIKVHINRSAYPDTTIETGEIRQTAEVFNSETQPNHAVLPVAVMVMKNNAWNTIVDNEDDNCPVNLSSGYLGAGHGYDRARKITAVNHGKTFADIGSEWVAGDDRPWNHAWLVRVVDADTLIFIGRNSNDNAYDTDAFSGTTLTHVSGAVHTGTITGTANVQYLLTPVDKNHAKKVMIDGLTEISEDGEYEALSFVDVIDEYDVINPQSIVTEIQANKPTGGYTDNPPINTGNTFLHFSNIYRYLLDGTMLIFTTLDNSIDVTLNYWGATQYAQKSAENVFGGALFRYVPKLLPIDSHELRIPFNMSNWNFTVNAIKDYWEDGDNPPDRLLHLFTDGSGEYVAGFAVGYVPVADGSAGIRKDSINNAMLLYNTKKAYPHLVDNGGASGSTWSAFKPFQSVVYRKPILDVNNVHTDAYCVPVGEKCYMYADYHSVADDRVKVPAEYVGKKITVLEKSSNVTVYGTIATDEIRIKCDTASPMYGYAVIQIA